MKRITFFSVVYATLVMLGGAMALYKADNLFPPLFEIFLSILIFTSSYMISKGKKFFNVVSGVSGFILLIYFWYIFYNTTNFYFGIMGAISGFFTFLYGMEILKIYTK